MVQQHWQWGLGQSVVWKILELIRLFSLPIWLVSTAFLVAWVLWGQKTKDWLSPWAFAPGPLGYVLILLAWWGRAFFEWLGKQLF